MKDSGQPLVLCVDDDPNMLHALERALLDAGLRVDLAGGGEEALQRVQAQLPDLILSDVRMPQVDGYELCSRLQQEERTARVPVIFVTAVGEEQEKARAFSVGAVDYLVKPFRQQDLLGKVQKHLQTGNRWKELENRRSNRIQPSDFFRFKEFLVGRLGAEPDVARRCAELSPTEIYSFGDRSGLPGELMASWIAEFLELPYTKEVKPEDLVLGVLPIQFCKSNSVVVVDAGDGVRTFVLSNPFNWQVLDLLASHVDPGQYPQLQIASPEALRQLFQDHDQDHDYVQDEIELLEAEAVPTRDEGAIDVLAGSDAPAIRLANAIIAAAVRMKASDIHLEPGEKQLAVRFRLDGMLVERKPVPKVLQASLISRLKIVAQMDIAERRVPQDGRIRVLYERRPVDLRVSTLPTRHGEKIVMRILDTSSMSLDLEALGLEEGPLSALRHSIKIPYGILLVTGPTGSGKTTTLYTALTQLNRPHTNIVTVEDPIEYELAGINQVQVHPTAGLTFPLALRAILRQDPDIILVGEIRDGETLDIAMKAALTGHLVLSTLHTNDAVSTISRLVDMGAEPFMVASTLEMISAQRLVRKLCPHCKEPVEVLDEVASSFGVPLEGEVQFFGPAGCEQCNEIGYRGRLAVAEAVVLDEEWRRLISRAADLPALRQHAADSGMSTLRQNGFRKAARGLTSIEEVLRVTM